MKKYLLLICISILLTSKTAKAQASLGIVVDSTFLIPNDSFALGSNVNFNVWVKNYGPGNFFPTVLDTFQVVLGVHDSATYATIHPLQYSPQMDSIAAGDSALVMLNANFVYNPSNGFCKDINVIVIWPYVGASVNVLDSLEFPVFLYFGTGVNEIDINDLIDVFPNPTTDYLAIENKGNLNIEEVRIMDSSGKLISTLKQPTKIQTSEWPQGMYLVQLVFDNKQSRSIRIIKHK